jgi:post-segregation antitoxin (ccd killing protein)
MPVRRPAVPAAAPPGAALAAALAIALAAALLLAPAAAAQVPVRSVSAVGSARVAVDRDAAQNSRAIGAAVESARERAIRRALANAREEATHLAAAGGLTLGALLAVEEPDPTPFFGNPSNAYGSEGTFGPVRYCGRIRPAIRRRDARGALRPTGRFRTRFGCRVPGEVNLVVRATFAVG